MVLEVPPEMLNFFHFFFFFKLCPCSSRAAGTQTPRRLALKPGSSSNTNPALNNYSLHTTASFCMFCMISPAVNKTGDQAAKRPNLQTQPGTQLPPLPPEGRDTAASSRGRGGQVWSTAMPRGDGRRPHLPGAFGAEGQVGHAEERLAVPCRAEHTAVFQR